MNKTSAVIQRLTQLLDERKLTINALSIRAGVTQSTVNDIFTGKTSNPGLSTLKKLCDGLDVSVRTFFNAPLFDDLEQEVK
ncbi:MAG: helix-turn-helix domain-containing protein [Oscillospiraceae bacterium]|jgi:transcriptional regulator with XRE-family HTH domain|nr:helix-turn-helix domain-containing protein [Oscillospiraceae bacterium]